MSLPVPSLQLMTDASETGWGGVLLPHSTSGTWPDSYLSYSMNWLELQAVFLSLQHFFPLLQGRCVQLFSDNTSDFLHSSPRHVAFRSSHAPLHADSGVLLGSLHLSHSKTPQRSWSLNVMADLNSHPNQISTDWTLDRKTFGWVCSSTSGLLRHQRQPPSTMLCLP